MRELLLLRTALAYAALGLRVHPLRPLDKRPLLSGWQRCATTDAAAIEAWWTRWTDAGVGIATGVGSGIIVIDVDPCHGGDAKLAELERAHGTLPDTWRCLTPSGGVHVYLRHPGGRVPDRVGVWLGIDVRGDGGEAVRGGNIVAPPTVLATGGHYAWEIGYAPGEVDLAAAPAWVVAALRVIPSSRDNGGRLPDVIPVGKRYNTLKSHVGYLRGCGSSERDILAALRELARTRMEQPAQDAITDDKLIALARWAGRLPVRRSGLRAQWEPIARTWPGRAGRTDRRVLLLAVLPIAARHLRDGASAVPLAARTVALAARVSPMTASRALARLTERGVLRRIPGRADDVSADRYTLVPVSHRGTLSVATSSLREDSVPRGDIAAAIADVSRHRSRADFRCLHQAFGHLAGDVYRVLSATVQSAVAIAVAACCARQSAHRTLRVLEAHGLAVRDADGWRRGPADLVVVAAQLGAADATARQRCEIHAERLRYRSAASRRRRENQRTRRRAIQQQLLALAERRGWPSMVVALIPVEGGAGSWRDAVSRARTRDLWLALGRLRRPSVGEDLPETVLELDPITGAVALGGTVGAGKKGDRPTSADIANGASAETAQRAFSNSAPPTGKNGDAFEHSEICECPICLPAAADDLPRESSQGGRHG